MLSHLRQHWQNRSFIEDGGNTRTDQTAHLWGMEATYTQTEQLLYQEDGGNTHNILFREGGGNIPTDRITYLGKVEATYLQTE